MTRCLHVLFAALILAGVPVPASPADPKPPETNIVLRNATLYDGSGSPTLTQYAQPSAIVL